MTVTRTRTNRSSYVAFRSGLARYGGYRDQKQVANRGPLHLSFRFNPSTGGLTSICKLATICEGLANVEWFLLSYSDLVRYEMGVHNLICRKCLEVLMSNDD